MTKKVGEASLAATVQGPAVEHKPLNSKSFHAIFQQVSQSSAHGPIVLPSEAPGAATEAFSEVVAPFTPGGTALDSDLGSAPGKAIDALELSLARPMVLAVRADGGNPAPLGPDAAELAALERVVERLSFGSDRRAAMARLELGGIWAGTVLVVRASGREVELQLELAGGQIASRELGERLAARLRSRGFATALSFG